LIDLSSRAMPSPSAFAPTGPYRKVLFPEAIRYSIWAWTQLFESVPGIG